MSRAVLAAVLTAFGLAAAPAGAEEVLLTHPALDRGDPAAKLEVLLQAVEAAPRDARVPALIAELRDTWELVPGGPEAARQRLEPLLERLADHANFEVIADALGQLRLSAGDRPGALALLGRRGLLDAFLAAGPFGTTPNAAVLETFGPEVDAARSEVDRAATFAALRGERRWKLLERDPRRDVLQLGDVLSGDGAASYAMTHIRVDADTPARLVYRGPSAKVWLNRAPVALIDRARARLSREVQIPLSLRSGWNRLLIKVVSASPPAIAARLTTPSGGPLAVEASAEPRAVPAGSGEAQPPYPSHALQELSLAREPQRRALYASELQRAGLEEEAWVELEDLARAWPEAEQSAWFWRLRARVVEDADHLPRALRRDRARAAHERALALDPEGVASRRALARFLIADEQTTEGALAYEALLAEEPRDLRTRLALLAALLRRSWFHPAEQLLREAPKDQQASRAFLSAWARLMERRGRDAEAAEARERLWELDRGAAWVLEQALQDALGRGDAAAAEATIERAQASLGLDAGEAAAQRTRAFRALGQRAKALAAMRSWVAQQPDEPGRRLALARRLAEDALADDAARAEAVTLLDGLLSELPELHEARALRRALAGETDRFWEEWTPDLESILKEAPDASHWPRASTVCLFDQTVTKIYPDASTVDVVHQVWRILTETGEEKYGSRPRAGELLEVRTIAPDGQVLEPIRTGTRTFEMPGLAPGAVVEHAFRLEQRAPGFQYENGPFYFQDPDLGEPFWFSRWVLVIHRDAPVTIIERNMDRKGIRKAVEERGAWRVHVYTAVEQPRMEKEPLAPERDELLPWIKVIEERSLDQVASVYREQALRNAAVGPTVTRKAAELVEGVESDAERARRLYRFVQEHVTRASGGVTAAQILAARGGSKRVLLRALLTAADVPNHLALAGEGPYGERIDWNHPEIGQFGKPLLWIAPRDGAPHYLVAEAHRLAPYGELPFQLWGAPALVVDPSGPFLDVVPSGELMGEANESELEVTLLPEGAADVRVTRTLPGFGLYRVKETFASVPASQLRGFFANQANAIVPGARVVETATPGLDAVGEPLRFWFRLRAERAVRPRGDGTLELRGLLSPTNLRRSLGTHRQRAFPMVIGQPIASVDRLRIELGPYQCPLLPARALRASRFGQFSLTVTREGPGRLLVERRVLIRPGRIEPDAYAEELLPFLQAVDEADRLDLILEPAR